MLFHATSATRPRVPARRATVLLVVLLVAAAAAVVATATMSRSTGAIVASTATERRAASRAAAWSGVVGVMAELTDQRAELLRGGTPRVTELHVFAGGADAPRTLIRLLPLAPAATPADVPALVQSEAAKLDLNTATADELGAIESIGHTVAARLIGARSQGPLGSPLEAARLAGVARDATAAILASTTAGSFDPEIRLAGATDQPRIVVEPAARAAIASLLPASSSDLAAKLRDGRTPLPRSRAELIRVLAGASVPPTSWRTIIDALAFSRDRFAVGRVDLNQASAEVLAALPGVGSKASELVRVRTTLDPAARASISWPVVEGILTPDELAQAADRLTWRSMQWRVRVEAGTEAPRTAGELGAGTDALEARTIYEAVVDLSTPVARVAYFRDVTQERAAERVSEWLAASRADAATEPVRAEPSGSTPDVDAPASSGPAAGATVSVPASAPGLPAARDRRLGRWLAAPTKATPASRGGTAP